MEEEGYLVTWNLPDSMTFPVGIDQVIHVNTTVKFIQVNGNF